MNKREDQHEQAHISNEEGRQAEPALGKRGSSLSHEPPRPTKQASAQAGDYPGAQTKNKHPRFAAPGEEHDADSGKGAVEADAGSRQRTNTTMEGQLPHRTESRLVKANDSDFPEPGNNPEHSGQQVEERGPRSPERDVVQQDPGHRQKQNQGGEKDDPLAA